MARPTKFKPEFIEQAKKLCAIGATDMEIADFFGVSLSTLFAWRAENREFLDAIKTAKDVADNRVERRLYERATGYSHPEVDIRVIDGKIVQTEIRKHYPPDTAAAFIWLKNRQPGRWRDKTSVEHTGPEGGPVQFTRIENAIVRPVDPNR